MDGITVNSDAFSQCPHDLESAALVAAKWQCLDRWKKSYQFANDSREQERIGKEKREEAERAARNGYSGEVPRLKKEMKLAFRLAFKAEAEIIRRENELAILRSSLLNLATGLTELVPFAKFRHSAPDGRELEQRCEQMFQLETKLRVLAAIGGGGGTQNESDIIGTQAKKVAATEDDTEGPTPTTIIGLILHLQNGNPDAKLPPLSEFKRLCTSDGRKIKPPKDHKSYESAKHTARKKSRKTIKPTIN